MEPGEGCGGHGEQPVPPYNKVSHAFLLFVEDIWELRGSLVNFALDTIGSMIVPSIQAAGGVQKGSFCLLPSLLSISETCLVGQAEFYCS